MAISKTKSPHHQLPSYHHHHHQSHHHHLHPPVTTNVHSTAQTELMAPTKTRIRALLLHQGMLSPYYPVRAVIAIGIALTVCGVTLTVFGSVAYIIEATSASICSGVWCGALVIIAGLVAVYAGNNPHSTLLVHVNLFVAIVSLAATGFMTILTANSVVKDSEGPPEMFNVTEDITANGALDISITESSSNRSSPAFMVNSLLLVTASLTAILSFANFCLTSREACQCYGLSLSSSQAQLAADNPLSSLGGADTLGRRDRIIAWILETASRPAEIEGPECPDSDLYGAGPIPSKSPAGPKVKEKLKPIHSNASTASTRLSAYEV